MPYATKNKKKKSAPTADYPQNKPTKVSKTIATAVAVQSKQQLLTSRQHKRVRLLQIRESEDLYHGIVEKTVRNPFNECFPFMSGFVDHMRSKIEDDSNLIFKHTDEADYKASVKIQAAYEAEANNPLPNASWSIKHRHAKYNAIFSGRAIYKYYSKSDPEYKSCLDVISHYDFHCEPRGGGVLENHLFLGQDNVYKGFEELRDNPNYDQDQVVKLLTDVGNKDHKENSDPDNIRNNRAEGLGQDPTQNNYVGQETVKLVEWYTTYKGQRYYVLFHESTGVWVKVCLLKEIFPDNLWPFVSWATNEDPDVFWSKAPADDARTIARIVNTMVNQELYNRQKRNYGKLGYDAEMFPNIQALADWRPDGLVPVNTMGGLRDIGKGLYEFKVGDLNGTLDLVTWLDTYSGRQMGNTPSSQGTSEPDKKVGVFQGEIQQVERFIGEKNESYRGAISHLGLLFQQGLIHNLNNQELAVMIMGAKGVEWTTISGKEAKTNRPLKISPVGGVSELQLKRIQDNEKFSALSMVATVNPQWKDRMTLLLKGFTEEDVKDAFSMDSFATKELLSEAAQAEKDIIAGKEIELNRGADSNFMQHIIDFATNTEGLTREQYIKLMDYAIAHTDIAVENEARNVKEMIRQKRIAMMTSMQTGQTETPPNKLSNPQSPGGKLPMRKGNVA